MGEVVVGVQYGRVTPRTLDDPCPRCAGIPQLTRECTRCHGWLYWADAALGLKAGDVVLVPPTPRHPDGPLEATVVSVGRWHREPTRAVLGRAGA